MGWRSALWRTVDRGLCQTARPMAHTTCLRVCPTVWPKRCQAAHPRHHPNSLQMGRPTTDLRTLPRLCRPALPWRHPSSSQTALPWPLQDSFRMVQHRRGHYLPPWRTDMRRRCPMASQCRSRATTSHLRQRRRAQVKPSFRPYHQVLPIALPPWPLWLRRRCHRRSTSRLRIRRADSPNRCIRVRLCLTRLAVMCANHTDLPVPRQLTHLSPKGSLPPHLHSTLRLAMCSHLHCPGRPLRTSSSRRSPGMSCLRRCTSNNNHLLSRSSLMHKTSLSSPPGVCGKRLPHRRISRTARLPR